MKARRLLYLTSGGMTAHHWQFGASRQEGSFSINERGRHDFARYLAKHPDEAFTLLANLPGERYQIESIPALRGPDRHTIIRRKLEQLYPGTTLTAALSLGYQKASRTNECVLFVALADNDDGLLPWLEALSTTGTPLVAVHSLPMLAGSLFSRLEITEPQCLLFTVQDQSLRQSYLKNGVVHFSRLTSLHRLGPDETAQAILDEAKHLHQHLIGRRVLTWNQSTSAYIIVPPSVDQSVRQQCAETGTLRFVFLSLADCARKTKLKGATSRTSVEDLFLNLMVTAPPSVQFADDRLRHDYHVRRVRTWLFGASAATLVCAGLASAMMIFLSHTLRQDAERARTETAGALQRYEQIVATLPIPLAKADWMRRAVERYLSLERRSATPVAFFHTISRALHENPGIELERIEWWIADAEAGGRLPESTTPAMATAAEEESIIVRGTMRPGSNETARQTLSAFERLVVGLTAESRLRVNVIKHPFDIGPEKTLSHGETESNDRKQRAFTLQLTRKIGS